jgi:hypothetical protein
MLNVNFVFFRVFCNRARYEFVPIAFGGANLAADFRRGNVQVDSIGNENSLVFELWFLVFSFLFSVFRQLFFVSLS